jgi:hypothetical protein
MKVTVEREGWSWNVYQDGACVALCGENQKRAEAVARDLRAGQRPIAWRRTTEKYL